MQEFRDIPYLENSSHGSLHAFDLYVPGASKHSGPLICFVHGGAWRSEDKSEHATTARRLAEGSSAVVAVPNYRLTTPENGLQHPGHAEDLLAFLHFIVAWTGPKSLDVLPYDPSRLYLIGHSCSAHMLDSIFLVPVPAAFPSLTPSDNLLAATKGIITSGGAYDIDLFLQSFPAYREMFVAAAFGDLQSYAHVNTAAYEMRKGEEHIRWLILHSKGDTLVNEVQSQNMFARLKTLCPDPANVENYLDLTQEHNELLVEDRYFEVVSKFITRTGE